LRAFDVAGALVFLCLEMIHVLCMYWVVLDFNSYNSAFCFDADSSLPIPVLLSDYKLRFVLNMAVPAETRTVRIHLPDGGFRYNEDIPVDTSIGEWVRATRAAYRFEGGRLEIGDRAFAEVLTFRNTPNVELQFVGTAAQHPPQPQQGKQV
jgi:hypothetical protein